jgi:DHA2 family multidrug resistance protein
VNDSVEPAPLRGSRLGILTIAISLATFMEVLDMTIVNVSIPAIAGTLGVSATEGTWTISSYTLAAAIMQPLTGWLGRRFGEVRTFALSGLLFIAFSALCGFATSMPMLVVGRLLQGLVSGPMVPMAQALLLRSYAPEKRGAAMGIWAMVVFVAPIFGPVLGGWITDNLSWPWLFYINVPVGLIAITVVWSLLRKRDTRRIKARVDFIGLALLIVGVGSLQFALDRGNELDWFESRWIVGAAAAAVMAISLLIAWELTDKHPVLDLHLFTHRNFTIGLTSICFGFFCFFGSIVLFPLWLQTTLGYTAQWAGFAMAPVGILGIVLMPFVGRNINRMNLRLACCFGFLVMAIVMLWSSVLTAQSDFLSLAGPRLLQGVGMAFFFMPLQTIMFSDVRSDEFAAASGMSSFLRNVAGSIAAAFSVWLWNERIDYHYSVLAGGVQQNAAWVDWSQRFANATGATAGDPRLLGYTQLQVQLQAQTMGYSDVLLLFTAIILTLMAYVWLARPPFKGMAAGGAH